jgi:hypothetical protein
MRGEPLMPTSCRKARLLLRKGKAVVVSRFPLIIRLVYATGENRQPITLGIDSGSSEIGYSSVTDEHELITGELNLDNKTTLRLTEKRMYRRNRRNKLRYRKPRFLNRKRNDDWLPPSILRKYNTHLNLIKYLRKILFIDKVKIEVGKFDIQKIINEDIQGIEYQQGNLYQYKNAKAFLLTRETGKCQLCGKPYEKNNPWKIHHIIERSKGGTNRVDNLALLHESCHKELHNKHLKLKKNKQFKDSTFMNIIRKRFKRDLDCEITYGYKTYIKRNELQLEKSHSNDAFVIAGGTNQTRSICYTIEQKRKNNRSIQLNRKGFKPSIRKQRYKYQPGDLVKINNKMFEVVGIFNYGTWIRLKDINNKIFNINIKKIEWSYNVKTLNFKINLTRKGCCLSSTGAKAP